MSRPQFAKYGLLRLVIGQDLERIQRGGYPRRVAPAAEVLALKPELMSPRRFSHLPKTIWSAWQLPRLVGVLAFKGPGKKSPDQLRMGDANPLFCRGIQFS